MAYNEHCAQIFRDALAHLSGITERKMFGGLCFMLNGNMLWGVDKNGGMARVGKENEAQALALRGVDPLSFTGRKMGGMVELDVAAVEDDDIRTAVLAMAEAFVGEMPAK